MPLAQLDELELPAGIQGGVIAYLVDYLGLEDEHSPKIERRTGIDTNSHVAVNELR